MSALPEDILRFAASRDVLDMPDYDPGVLSEQVRSVPEEAPEDDGMGATAGPDEKDFAASGYTTREEWSEKPSVPNQIDASSFCRSTGLKVHFLDLKKPDDVFIYQNILDKLSGPFRSAVLVKEERRDFDWNVLLVVQYFEFKKIIKLDTVS